MLLQKENELLNSDIKSCKLIFYSIKAYKLKDKDITSTNGVTTQIIINWGFFYVGGKLQFLLGQHRNLNGH